MKKTAFCGLLDRDLPVVRPTTMVDLQHLRNDGLREAALGQVILTNAARLCWVEYSNGDLRLNIWPDARVSRLAAADDHLSSGGFFTRRLGDTKTAASEEKS